jgi:hypothetical protein
MTTATWNTTATISDTTTYRAAGSELNAKLAALGCVQTADTGQINWTTITWPAQNTDSGYEIWRFADALQGTSPIFFKITYGRPNNASNSYLSLKVNVGSGSNGSGTLTGTTSTINQCGMIATPTVGNFVSYGCMVNGNLLLALKLGSGGEQLLAICRTQDSTGADTATGVHILQRSVTANQSLYHSTINWSTPALVQNLVQGANALRLGALTSSLVGADNQAYIVWGAYPAAIAHIAMCGIIDGEIASGSTFTATLFGSTSHTYLCLTGIAAYIGSTNLRPCMLYE